jgi:subtilisin family serine protease
MKIAGLIITILFFGIADAEFQNDPFAVQTAPPKKWQYKKTPIVIAVIDSGFGYKSKGQDVKLCRYGHKDFTNSELVLERKRTEVPVPFDTHGHGTHVAGIINKYASTGSHDYCLVIIKYYTDADNLKNTLNRTIQAFDYARKIKVDVINYSGGGLQGDLNEIASVKKFLDGGGVFVGAAGNETSDLLNFPFYPAMDDNRIVAVGNLEKIGKRAPTSNYGKRISCWEVGTNVLMYDISLTGTSQAAAIATGKLVANKPCGSK